MKDLGRMLQSASQHTSLFAVDAVALDTETTGPDARSARVIEIGAVVVGAEEAPNQQFQTLVAIPDAIPASATEVHGICDTDLKGAREFAAIFPDLTEFIGCRPVIGHSIGFDIAILRRECVAAGLTLPTWPVLDIRLLAQAAAPTLADFSLETLAKACGVQVVQRHRALPDAIMTARIFRALLPRVRDAGIRTFGEAERACWEVARSLAVYNPAGVMEPAVPGAAFGPRVRGDTYPYRHRVHELMARTPVCVPDQATLGEALAKMVELHIGSVFVGSPGALSVASGILTERDVLRAISRGGAAALRLTAAAIASRPLISLPEDAFAYEAIGQMRRHKIRHLAIVNREGRVSGAVSSRDLLRFMADDAVLLGNEIDGAADLPALARAWAKVAAVSADLMDDGFAGRELAAIVARELCALTRRAGELAAQELLADGTGPPPCPYALLVLGSGGRGESLLALDQDNAVIFATGEPDGPEDRWFATFGARVNNMLHAVGVPLCTGGVMAGNPAFRGSLRTWRDRVSVWLNRAGPEDLLNVDIFFDFEAVLGDHELANELWRNVWPAAARATPFLRLLSESAGMFEAPFGLLGRVKTKEGRIDLKQFGLRPIVHGARLLALRHGIAVRSTAERLSGVRALGVGGAHDLTAAAAAHDRFMRRIAKAQLADMAAGRPATNRVPLDAIKAEAELDQLKSDLRTAVALNELAREQIAAAPG